MSSSLDKSGAEFIGPTQHIHAGLVLQTLFVDLVVDTTTNSQVFVTLLSTVFTKKSDASYLRIAFSSSASNNNANTQLRFGLYVNGVFHRGCGCRGQGTFSQAATMIHAIKPDEVPAGEVTVEIRWEVSAGQGQIRPVTHPDDESASFIVDEVLLP